jgi:hypothetical protein
MQVSFAQNGKDRASTVSALTERIGAVEALLDRDGVQVRDRRLSVNDRWDGKRRSGVVASQSYTVRITDLAVLNDLVADLVTVEPTHLNGPHWELTDQDEAQLEAQSAAVADARSRAEGYAVALGRELGELVRITDGASSHGAIALSSRAVSMSASVSVGRPDISELSLEPQLVAVTVMCTMTWTIA